MTSRHDLETHRQSLSDIREIMNSMKSLAYMQSRKLSHYLDAQRAAVRSIEQAASDLLTAYPDLLPTGVSAVTQRVFVLVGTERGFCGSFNHRLTDRLREVPGDNDTPPPLLVAIGQKLHSLLQGDPRLAIALKGAAFLEDIPSLLHQLAQQLVTLQEAHGVIELSCLYHETQDNLIWRTFLPPFRDLPPATGSLSPPVLNLSPALCLSQLSEHYLLATLHEIFYTSLSAENINRMTHLDTAVKKLDDTTDDLVRRSNALRQEEIIEEIEVLLLNASSP